MHNQYGQKQVFWTPRKLAMAFMIFGVIFTALTYYPISLVFSGQWKMNQKIDLFNQVVINYEALGLKSITESLGWDTINPIGTISIRFYAISILLGVLAGYFLTLHLSKLNFIAGTIIDRLLIGLIIFGIIGARLFFVIFKWDFFINDPSTVITTIFTGGMAFFGMFALGLGYIWIYCNRYRFNFFEFLDFISPGLLLGQIIGRWGNFFNYESYGPETAVFWKMYVPESANYYFDSTAKYFHPTFLYEIIPNYILLILLLFYYEKLTEKRSGIVFAFYAIGYGLIRTFTEFFRLDSLKINLPSFLYIPLGYFGEIQYLLASQLAAIALLIFGFYIIAKRRRVVYFKKNMSEFNIF